MEFRRLGVTVLMDEPILAHPSRSAGWEGSRMSKAPTTYPPVTFGIDAALSISGVPKPPLDRRQVHPGDRGPGR